jgi:hypothetical protein
MVKANRQIAAVQTRCKAARRCDHIEPKSRLRLGKEPVLGEPH